MPDTILAHLPTSAEATALMQECIAEWQGGTSPEAKVFPHSHPPEWMMPPMKTFIDMRSGMMQAVIMGVDAGELPLAAVSSEVAAIDQYIMGLYAHFVATAAAKGWDCAPRPCTGNHE